MVSLHQRMIGNANLAGQILGAGGLIGEDAGQQIVGAHALDRRWNLAAAGESRHSQRARGVPFPARAEHGRIEQRLRQHMLHRGGFRKLNTISSGKEC